MTNEEIIKVLHELDGSLYETQQVALDLAIKALEQPTRVEDLLKQVSEQEKWLNSAGYNAYNVDIAFKSIIRAIENVHITTSDDCVSRAEALEMIEQIQDAGGFIGYSTYSEARYQVNNMSPVTPSYKWIPVSGWLPRQGVEILTCNECGFIEIQSLEDGYWENQHGDFLDLEDSDIVVWMPLPKPYEEKRGSEE